MMELYFTLKVYGLFIGLGLAIILGLVALILTIIIKKKENKRLKRWRR